MSKKAVTGRFFLVVGFIIGILILFTVSVSAENDTNANLMTFNEMDALLQKYFREQNNTVNYNTYNENNQFNEYYNQTFLNQTFVDNNYYNTYNTYYNQTFLNQTFVDNNYYNTYNTYYNQTFIDNTYNTFVEYHQTFVLGNEKINLENDSVEIGYNECREIKFDFKDTFINAIKDDYAPLNISTNLSQAQNVNFISSFFVDTSHVVVENNMQVQYDSINTNADAIRVEGNGGDSFTAETYNVSGIELMQGGIEIIINVALSDWDDADRITLLEFFEEQDLRYTLYSEQTRLVLRDNLNGVEVDIEKECRQNNAFCQYKLILDENGDVYIERPDEQTSNSLNNIFNTDGNLYIVGDSESQTLDSDFYYYRSIYVNKGDIVITDDKFKIGTDEYSYDKEYWNHANLYIQDESIFYSIGNNAQHVTNGNPENSSLFIDTTKTNIMNAYCVPNVE